MLMQYLKLPFFDPKPYALYRGPYAVDRTPFFIKTHISPQPENESRAAANRQ